jgi:hypothetical protein
MIVRHPNTGHGRGTPVLAPAQIIADGVWTWFSDPRAVYYNGATYIMAVDSAGTCRIHKYVHATGVTTSTNLSSVGLEIDDHNNGSLVFLSNGKIVAFYGQHNDSTFRYKVSTNAEDITSWSAEQARGSGEGNYSYPNCFELSQVPGKHWLFTRRWKDGGATRNPSYRTFTDLGTIPSATVSAYTDVFEVSSQRPYWKIASNGVDTLHFAITNGHPNETTTSLYHFYMQLVAGVPKYYTSAGVEITAGLPFGTANVTQVYDGSSTECWVSDCAIDGSGYPRILWMRYPGNDGSAIEYYHARWNGSTWTNVKITDDGAGLYSGELFYHGGLCFDSQDISKVYLSKPVSSVRQIQKWATTDNGATWSKTADVTSGGSSKRLRPYSPRNHNGYMPLIWLDGTYTTYTNYNMAIWGSA